MFYNVTGKTYESYINDLKLREQKIFLTKDDNENQISTNIGREEVEYDINKGFDGVENISTEANQILSTETPQR